ncbi:MAG: HAD-IIB family hydrolase [Gammaproteobacteria bacterium]
MKVKHEKSKLYIVLISVHGLIRSHDLELGRDADTGGQTLYVTELARALAAHPDVECVDLLTRRINDSKIDLDYQKPIEALSPHARLIRLDCGPKRYLRKEVLWPYLDAFIDKSLQHIRTVGRVPDIIHSHYADAGLVGSQLAGLLGIPFIYTGHSLGHDKLAQLLNNGIKPETIESRYNISQRIEAEEVAIGSASMVIASTHQEVNQQYARYDNYQPKRMTVIPPGVDLSRFHPPVRGERYERIVTMLSPFLNNPKKPMIVAVSRADERKNISALIRAYGESAELQSIANLIIIAGNRDDITTLDKGARVVLTDILILIDRYNLYGKVAYPKHHQSEDIPALFQLACHNKGVFINPALTEPFGLTLIEAAASGLPIVATNDGGPKEIISLCHNGEVIDPHNIQLITEKLKRVLQDSKCWKRWSKNGIKNVSCHFSWKGHTQHYIEEIHKRLHGQYRKRISKPVKSRLPMIDRLAFSAIDDSLIGDEKGLSDLMHRLKHNANHNIGFGVATGRSLESVLKLLKHDNIPIPDVIISSVGSEIYYYHIGKKLIEDKRWKKLINYRWEPDAIKSFMMNIPNIKIAPIKEQREHKISYRIKKFDKNLLSSLKKQLRQNDIHAKVIITQERYLDILPIRASKGLAIRYIAIKWGLPLERIFVAGDAGNDEEMLRGDTLAVVVSNHSSELLRLKNKPRVYFSEKSYASGILEGLEYYEFLDNINNHDQDGIEIPSVVGW